MDLQGALSIRSPDFLFSGFEFELEEFIWVDFFVSARHEAGVSNLKMAGYTTGNVLELLRVTPLSGLRASP